MRSLDDMSSGRPRTLDDFRPQPFQLSAEAVGTVAGLDMNRGIDRGRLRTFLMSAPPGSAWHQVLKYVDARFQAAQKSPASVPPPDARLPEPAAAPEPLSATELELLRRMDGDLRDEDVDLLVELHARTDGTDRMLVERVLGDAHERRFERQKAAHLADLKKRPPTPVGSDPEVRRTLENLLTERLAADFPDLREHEARTRAREQLDQATAAATTRWQAQVAAVEAMRAPSLSRHGSSGMEAGRRRAAAENAARKAAQGRITDSLRLVG